MDTWVRFTEGTKVIQCEHITEAEELYDLCFNNTSVHLRDKSEELSEFYSGICYYIDTRRDIYSLVHGTEDYFRERFLPLTKHKDYKMHIGE